MGSKRVTNVGMSSNRLEEMTCDKHGDPIPILGIDQADAENVAEFALATGSGAAVSGPLKIGYLYMLTATQQTYVTAALVAIKLNFNDALTTCPVRLLSPNGQIVYIFKARTTSVKIEVLSAATLNVALFRLG